MMISQPSWTSSPDGAHVRDDAETRVGDGAPRDVGLGVLAVVAQLEREYGQARLLRGAERKRLAESLGCFHRAAVIDVGNGLLATVGPRGGGLRIHDLRT
jgi:hypothetical protein